MVGRAAHMGRGQRMRAHLSQRNTLLRTQAIRCLGGGHYGVHDPRARSAATAVFRARRVRKWVKWKCVAVSFQHLMLPDRMTAHTPLLDVHPVSVQVLGNASYGPLHPQGHIANPIQSQVFHTLYHWDTNAPGRAHSSGKTIVAELAILRLLTRAPRAITVYGPRLGLSAGAHCRLAGEAAVHVARAASAFAWWNQRESTPDQF